MPDRAELRRDEFKRVYGRYEKARRALSDFVGYGMNLADGTPEPAPFDLERWEKLTAEEDAARAEYEAFRRDPRWWP